MYGGPPPPPPPGGGPQPPPYCAPAASAPYDPYQPAGAAAPAAQHYGEYGAPPPMHGYSYGAPPPPPPASNPSNAGREDEYDPFAVVGASSSAPPPPPPPPDEAPPPPPPPPTKAPPPPPPPPPPPEDGSSIETYRNAERKQEDDALRDMEAQLQAEKEAHARRVGLERMRQHQTQQQAARKAVPTVAMRGRPAGALLKRKGAGFSAASVFSRGDSSDEEEGAGKEKQWVGGGAASAVAEAAGGEQEAELTEEARAAIRRVAEWLVGGGTGQEGPREAALLVRARTDPSLSFLLLPPPGGKPSAAHAFFLEVKEELRVKEQVRQVSMGLSADNTNENSNTSHNNDHNNDKYGPLGSVGMGAVQPTFAPPEQPQQHTHRRKRNRWGPVPGEPQQETPAAPGLGVLPPPAVVAEAAVADVPVKVKTAYLPTVMDEAAARQLREQKKMQLLEQRIREAARAQLAGAKDAKAREVALFEERRRQYEALAEKDDKDFRDTVAMAERTGGVIEGGTWEHRKRAKEMLKTADTALELTLANKGKHHIADFLPEDELEKFLTNADAAAAGKKEALPAEEDYEKHKLDAESHLGMKMLKRQGWEEGSGLGKEGKEGTAAPVNTHKPAGEAAGIGVAPSHEVEEGDDAFDQYRKRMMLAYRFRPNPMNNPRRAYY